MEKSNVANKAPQILAAVSGKTIKQLIFFTCINLLTFVSNFWGVQHGPDSLMDLARLASTSGMWGQLCPRGRPWKGGWELVGLHPQLGQCRILPHHRVPYVSHRKKVDPASDGCALHHWLDSSLDHCSPGAYQPLVVLCWKILDRCKDDSTKIAISYVAMLFFP